MLDENTEPRVNTRFIVKLKNNVIEIFNLLRQVHRENLQGMLRGLQGSNGEVCSFHENNSEGDRTRKLNNCINKALL
jgi:hypothetical protein